MSFAQTLKRLRENLDDERNMTRDRDKVLVRRRDLRWLLDDWESMDQKAREQHRKDHPELYP